MHDLIFGDQAAMAPAKYVEYAQKIGLNVETFKKDVAGADVKKRVDDDAKEAASLGVSSTPAFFINGLYTSGARPFEQFKQLIDQELSGGGAAAPAP